MVLQIINGSVIAVTGYGYAFLMANKQLEYRLNMQIDWTKIKENVLLNCTNAFSESSLPITEDEIEEAFIIFRNFVVHPMPGCDDIRGLETDFCEALLNCCTTGVGSIHYLETVSTDCLFLNKVEPSLTIKLKN